MAPSYHLQDVRTRVIVLSHLKKWKLQRLSDCLWLQLKEGHRGDQAAGRGGYASRAGGGHAALGQSMRVSPELAGAAVRELLLFLAAGWGKRDGL